MSLKNSQVKGEHSMGGIIDIHTHVFSLDPERTGCTLSKVSERRIVGRYLRWKHGICASDPAERAEAILQQQWLKTIEETKYVDQIVILAHDAVFSRNGERLDEQTHFYIPNDYVLALAREHSRLLPAASIHPYRKDALEELDRVVEEGAVLIKWLPNTQGFDPSDRKNIPFFRKLLEYQLPLLCHTGPEFALKPLDQSLGHPFRLQLALEEGVTVIAAHGGGWGWVPGFGFKRFVEMLLKYSHFYTDTSALTLPPRSRYLLTFLDRPELHAKLVHGSDYPLPVSPWPFVHRLAFKEARRIAAIPSPFDRDLLIKRALGFPESVFERAAGLLRLKKQSHLAKGGTFH
jgi:predicted TIM-barrel fold metal-dependent hydrolase